MFNVPVTYLFDFPVDSDRIRPYIMHEFAVNGAKYLVLNDIFVRMIMNRREMAEILQKEMQSEGLTFCDAHAVFGKYLDLNCPVEDARFQMLMRHKLQLQIAASMGVDTITIHIGNETQYPDYPLATQIEYVKRSLDELLPAAEQLGVTICIENIWSRINTPEQLLDFKAAYPTAALGFCYDAGHANLMDKGRNYPDSNPYAAWGDVAPAFDDRILEKMLPHVVNCHLHDNNGIKDQHLNIGLGSINWQHITSLLKQAPRLRVIQSEVIPMMTNCAIKDVCEKMTWLSEL